MKNPIPETLTGHRLRAVTGVFGVLFQLLVNFLKLTIYTDWYQSVSLGTIISATEKKHKNPKNPFLFYLDGVADGPLITFAEHNNNHSRPEILSDFLYNAIEKAPSYSTYARADPEWHPVEN